MLRKHTISIKNAWNGLKWAVTTQPNYKIHFLLSLLAFVGGIFFRISYAEFLTIAVLVFVGLALETVNTAIEEASDAIDTKWREDIKITKDVSAGAMLVFAIGALAIASIIFVPKILLFTRI